MHCLKSLQVTKVNFRLQTKDFGAYISILFVYTLFFYKNVHPEIYQKYQEHAKNISESQTRKIHFSLLLLS